MPIGVLLWVLSSYEEEGASKVQDTPSFWLLHRFSSSDYAELTEHSARRPGGFEIRRKKGSTY